MEFCLSKVIIRFTPGGFLCLFRLRYAVSTIRSAVSRSIVIVAAAAVLSVLMSVLVTAVFVMSVLFRLLRLWFCLRRHINFVEPDKQLLHLQVVAEVFAVMF